MRTALILEGGAMRGMYTAGVLDTLMDAGIRVDGIVGVSAGALFGVNFLSGQRGRVIRYNRRFNKDKNYLGLVPLIKEGNIVSTEYAYHTVPHVLDVFDDEAYKKSGVPYYAVVTDIQTGQPQYIKIESVFDQMHVLRASGSMPFVSRPVHINGRLYLDGGIADSIPFEWMRAQGYDRLIVVLTQHASYVKKPMRSLPIKIIYRKYPNLVKRLLKRHTEYNAAVKTLSEWEKSGKAFVIRPSAPIKISKIEKDEEKLQSVYDLGAKDMQARLCDLTAYLK